MQATAGVHSVIPHPLSSLVETKYDATIDKLFCKQDASIWKQNCAPIPKLPGTHYMQISQNKVFLNSAMLVAFTKCFLMHPKALRTLNCVAGNKLLHMFE